MPSYAYTKLLKRTGQDNAPGIKKRVLVAPRSSFAILAEPAGTVGNKLRIAADHTFELGMGWVELYTTLDTGSLTAETVGERDSRSTNPKVECFHPGIYAEALEFAEEAKNDEWIALVQQLDGTYVQLGSDGLECDITYSAGSGTVSSGANGLTFTIECFGKLFLYEGAITLKP